MTANFLSSGLEMNGESILALCHLRPYAPIMGASPFTKSLTHLT